MGLGLFGRRGEGRRCGVSLWWRVCDADLVDRGV